MTDVNRLGRRTLALALLALAAAVIWLGVLSPLVALWQTEASEIADLNEQLGPLRDMAGRGPRAAWELADLQSDIAQRQAIWTGVSPAAVSAAIQTTVRQAVAENGGSVRSVADATPTTDHRLLRLTVRFDVEGQLETLRKLLVALRASRPLLFVDTLSVIAPERQPSRDVSPNLSIRFAVSGYMRGAAP